MPWTNTQYACWTTEGVLDVEGLSNGTFGIDERPNLRWPARKKAWAVIHLGTGYAAAFFEGNMAAAKRFASELTDVADWDLDCAEAARANSRAVKPVFDKHRESLLSNNDIGSLKPAFKYPEEIAESQPHD